MLRDVKIKFYRGFNSCNSFFEFKDGIKVPHLRILCHGCFGISLAIFVEEIPQFYPINRGIVFMCSICEKPISNARVILEEINN